MKKIFLIWLILWPAVAVASGIDDMALWRYQIPAGDTRNFSLEPIGICRTGIRAMALYTNPYQVNSLHWGLMGVQYGFGRWGIAGLYRNYGLDRLYSDNLFSGGISLSAFSHLFGMVGIDYERENFNGEAVYDRADLSLMVSYSRGTMGLQAQVKKLNLKKAYIFDDVNRPEPGVAGWYKINESLRLSAALRDLPGLGQRWYLAQKFSLADNLDIYVGFVNRPNLLNCGVDFSWKTLTLSLSYIVIGHLNDSVIFGLAGGK